VQAIKKHKLEQAQLNITQGGTISDTIMELQRSDSNVSSNRMTNALAKGILQQLMLKIYEKERLIDKAKHSEQVSSSMRKTLVE
jgi:hypothetical protein